MVDEIVETERKSSVTEINEQRVRRRSLDNNSGLNGDYGNLCLLLLLYTLQGIPIGLMMAIPMILSSNGVKYEKQAILSVANYPNACKLIWAPIVDSVYSTRLGRRKTWLIPIQYFIGGMLIVISTAAVDLIGSKTLEPQIGLLTSALFFIILLVSIQDTVVDAWGLTLLQRHNVHLVASANAVGFVFGTFISTVVFLSLESPDFCNKWLRRVPQETGILDIQTFLFLVGLLFVVSTTIIWIFKSEGNIIAPGDETRGPLHTYKLLLRVLRLKSILLFALFKLTHYIGISMFSAASELKLIQFGIRREILSIIKAPISVLNLVLPFLVAHLTKKAPLVYFWKFGLARQLVGISIIALVYWTQSCNQPEEFPLYFYAVTFGVYVIYDIFHYTTIMSIFAYTTTISDPNIGATYMTLFSTLGQIGMKFAKTLSLALIDPLTLTRPVNVMHNLSPTNLTLNLHANYTSLNIVKINETSLNSTMISLAKKEVIVDGFYVEGAFCTLFGLLWFPVFKNLLWRMQSWPLDTWRLKEFRSNRVENNDENKNHLNVSLVAVSALNNDDNVE